MESIVASISTERMQVEHDDESILCREVSDSLDSIDYAN